MNYGPLQFLDAAQPLVDPETGKATEYFLSVLGINRGATEDAEEEAAAALAGLADKADKSIMLSAGLGLDGGGDLSSNRSFDLNAALDDLSDVDTTTTPPTDGQALAFDLASGLWLPETISGGGGGGGGAPFSGAKISLNGVNTAIANATIPFTTASFDTDGWFVLAQNGFVVPTGITKVLVTACMVLTTDPANTQMWFKVNGVQRATSGGDMTFGTNTIAEILNVVAGDIIQVHTDVTATLNGAAFLTNFAITALQSTSTSGAAWQLAASWSHAASGNLAALIANVTGASEVYVIFDNVTCDSATWRTIRVSNDGGATYLSGASDYVPYTATGTIGVAGDTYLYTHATGSSLARSSICLISGLNLAAPKPYIANREANVGLVRSNMIVNALRVGAVAGLMTGGAVYVLKR